MSFSFQINISVKIIVGLLRNLYRNLNEKFVSDQSSGLKEMFQECMGMRWSIDEIFGSLVQQVIFPPLQRASLSREDLGYNWKQSVQSNRSRLQQAADNVWVLLYEHFHVKVGSGLDKPNPKLLGQDKPRLELAEKVDFVPFRIRGVGVLCKPRPEWAAAYFLSYKRPHWWIFHVKSAPFAHPAACCCILLGVVASPFAHHCQHRGSNLQHIWSNVASVARSLIVYSSNAVLAIKTVSSTRCQRSSRFCFLQK